MSNNQDNELSDKVLDSVAGGGGDVKQADAMKVADARKPFTETKVEVTPEGVTRFTTTAHMGIKTASAGSKKPTS